MKRKMLFVGTVEFYINTECKLRLSRNGHHIMVWVPEQMVRRSKARRRKP